MESLDYSKIPLWAEFIFFTGTLSSGGDLYYGGRDGYTKKGRSELMEIRWVDTAQMEFWKCQESTVLVKHKLEND